METIQPQQVFQSLQDLSNKYKASENIPEQVMQTLTSSLQDSIKLAKASRFPDLLSSGILSQLTELSLHALNQDVQIMCLYSLESFLPDQSCRDLILSTSFLSPLLETAQHKTFQKPKLQRQCAQLLSRAPTSSFLQLKGSGAFRYLVSLLRHPEEKVLESGILALYQLFQQQEFLDEFCSAQVIETVLQLLGGATEFQTVEQNLFALLVVLSTSAKGSLALLNRGAAKRLVEVASDSLVGQWQTMSLLVLGNIAHDKSLADRLCEETNVLKVIQDKLEVFDMKSGELALNALDAFKNLSLFASAQHVCSDSRFLDKILTICTAECALTEKLHKSLLLNSIVCIRNLIKKQEQIAQSFMDSGGMEIFTRFLTHAEVAIQCESCRTICSLTEYQSIHQSFGEQQGSRFILHLVSSSFQVLQQEGLQTLERVIEHISEDSLENSIFVTLAQSEHDEIVIRVLDLFLAKCQRLGKDKQGYLFENIGQAGEEELDGMEQILKKLLEHHNEHIQAKAREILTLLE